MSNGRFPWKAYVITFVVIVLIAAAPLLSVIFTAYVAEANGCVVDEGSVHSCMIGGSDWGETLYFTGMMGWFMLATIPLGGGALIVWFVLLVIHYIAWRRKALMP
ncbi:hypothetical protein [Devosia aurantiaca]|uniref:Uncharacterized protein n=1 Tax=Devosia aurantiaca TaxID=2714858 RepID=A0A6M1SIR9_9HYPH|nr:hypothetical protein [Devosia aurantiaca]NGP16734.1 hypothetical protein [Devosia aurantiaca]